VHPGPSPEFAITAVLAEAPGLTDALPNVLRVLCEGFDWDLGEAWLVVADARLIQLRSIWHVPTLEGASWENISRGIAIQRGRGLVGRAWDKCEFQWTADIRSDPSFWRAEQAAKTGLQAACALPLCHDEVVSGVVVLLSRNLRKRDGATAERLIALGHQIGRFARSYSATHRGEVYLSDLMDSIHDIAAVLGIDGTIIYENAAVEEVLGYSLGERIGRNVFDFIHQDDIPIALDAFQRALQSVGSVQRLEVRARHRDGRWVWLETVGSIRNAKSGMVAVAVSRDVTERRLREAGGPAPEEGKSAPAEALSRLTEPEVRILRLMARGLSNREIARTLNLSPHTVKEYVANVLRKLGARNRTHAAALAAEHGLS